MLLDIHSKLWEATVVEDDERALWLLSNTTGLKNAKPSSHLRGKTRGVHRIGAKVLPDAGVQASTTKGVSRETLGVLPRESWELGHVTVSKLNHSLTDSLSLSVCLCRGVFFKPYPIIPNFAIARASVC